MKRKNCLLFFVLSVLSTWATESDIRRVIELEDEWKFINRDVREGAAIDLDDSDWEVMSIPHDWAIIKPFDMNMDMQRTQVIEDGETKALLRTGRTGALNAFGVGWYRKKIIVSEQDRGKKYLLSLTER